jgi:hypothetical protein
LNRCAVWRTARVRMGHEKKLGLPLGQFL